MSYLKRTGTGINDVIWDGTPLATEEYVNTTVTTAVPAGKFVETTGGTMTGELVLSGNPTQDNGAANKKYVDDAISGAAPAGDYMLKTGDTMTGNLNMSDNQITNVNTMTATNIIVKGTSDASASIKVTGDASRSELDLNDASNNPVVLKGVDTPADNNDAANKQYVDTVDTKVTNLQSEVDRVKNTVTNITNGSTELPYLPIAGGTLTGTLTLSGEPVTDNDAVTKAYVDKATNNLEEVTVTPIMDGVTLSGKGYIHNSIFLASIEIYGLVPPSWNTNYPQPIAIFKFNTSKKIADTSLSLSDLEGLSYPITSGNTIQRTVGYNLTLTNNIVYLNAAYAEELLNANYKFELPTGVKEGAIHTITVAAMVLE